MPHSFTKGVTLAATLGALLFGAQPVEAQVAVISARSFEALRSDGKALATLLKKAEWVQRVNSLLQVKTGPTDPEGLDLKRPLGAYVNWPDRPAELSSWHEAEIFFVPVAEEKRFLNLLQKLGCKPRKAAGTLHRLTVPGKGQLYLRFANRYAYAASQAALVKGKLPDPATFFPKAPWKSTLAARIHVDRFPKTYRRVIDDAFKPLVALFDEFLGDSKKQPTESAAEYRRRLAEIKKFKALPEALKTGITSLIGQTREVTINLGLDRKTHLLNLEVALIPRPDTAVATFSKYAGTARSRFGSLIQDSHLGLLVHFPGFATPKEVVNLRVPPGVFRGWVKPMYQSAWQKYMEILIPTIAKDGLDFAFTVWHPLSGGGDGAILAGLKVRNGRKLDYMLRDLYKNASAADKADFGTIRWNHSRHARATIHRVQFKDDTDINYLALRDDVVFAADGEEGLKLMKKALDRFGKSAAAATPLFHLHARGAWFFTDKKVAASFAKKFPRADREKIGAEINLRGGKDLRLSVEFHAYLLELVPMILEAEEE
jgi:hypothetical protein